MLPAVTNEKPVELFSCRNVLLGVAMKKTKLCTNRHEALELGGAMV